MQRYPFALSVLSQSTSDSHAPPLLVLRSVMQWRSLGRVAAVPARRMYQFSWVKNCRLASLFAPAQPVPGVSAPSM